MIGSFGKAPKPFIDLVMLHDLILDHNNLTKIEENVFKGLMSLQTLDMSNNEIEDIHEDAFTDCEHMRTINLGSNKFNKFPTKGLKNLIDIKTHNNPNLVDFPTAKEFPKVQNLVMSYAYHCCQFMPSTFENFIPEYGEDYDTLKEEIEIPGDIGHWNSSEIIWTTTNGTHNLEAWDNLGILMGSDYIPSDFVTPRPGIQCMPAPGPFLPCNDLFDWWTLRCSVWIVFLLALLGIFSTFSMFDSSVFC